MPLTQRLDVNEFEQKNVVVAAGKWKRTQNRCVWRFVCRGSLLQVSYEQICLNHSYHIATHCIVGMFYCFFRSINISFVFFS